MDPFSSLKFQEKRFFTHLKSFSEKDRSLILKAYRRAKKYHSGQQRDEGGPYILHCLRVASCLIEELNIKNPQVICAALLHDTLEDTDLKPDKIFKNLGPEVTNMIVSLTRNHRGDTKKNKYERKYQKFTEIIKMEKDIRAIKACDWLDAIYSWPRIPKDQPAQKKLKRWFKEAKTMYIPLAKTVSPKIVVKMKDGLKKITTSSVPG
jgi:guanosine-3',5'-bis(diphosphate) 3'-pyrophosphohydrolase